MKPAAVVLHVLGLFAAYGWQLLPDDFEVQAAVFNMSQALQMIVTLSLVAVLAGSRDMTLVCGFLSLYALMVVGCNAWWLAAPWPDVAGQGRCSTRLNWPLGILGVTLGLFLLIRLVRDHE